MQAPFKSSQTLRLLILCTFFIATFAGASFAGTTLQTPPEQQPVKSSACNIILSPSTINAPSGGGFITVFVSNLQQCQWVASGSPWADAAPSTSSSPGMLVAIDVESNIGPARTSTMNFGNAVLKINQSAGACTYAFDVPVHKMSGSGYGFLNVTKSNAQCPMSPVTSTASWLKVLGATHQNSVKEQVEYQADGNLGPERTAQIKIGNGSTTFIQFDACSTKILTPSANVSASNGTGTIDIDLSSPACPVSLDSNSAWLTTTPAVNGKINYFFTQNNSGVARVGTITINSKLFTVTQTAAVCTYSVNNNLLNYQANGGTGGVSVTTQAQCSWSSVSNAAWIKVNVAQSTGNGPAAFTVDANQGPARTGTLTVAGKTVTVNQAAAAGCNVALSTSIFNFQAGTASSSIQVTALGCAWTASSQAAWVKVNPGQGNGNGVVNLTIDANQGPPRSASINIGDKVATINQLGTSCTLAIAPSTIQIGTGGGEVNINVTASDASCAWTTGQPSDTFIALTSGLSGTGNGVSKVKIQANNTQAARTATILIAGKILTVNQDGTLPLVTTLISISPNAVPVGTQTLTMMLDGTNFTTKSRVHLNGAERATTFYSSTSLAATILPGDMLIEGVFVIAVVNQDTNSKSNSRTFSVYGKLANVSAASYSGPTLARDAIVAAFGSDLAKNVMLADKFPLPTNLEGTTVTVTDALGNDHPAQLFFASTGQVNYLMPGDVAIGKATVAITSAAGPTKVGAIEIADVAPGLFTADASGKGAASLQILRITASGEQIYEQTVEYVPEKGFIVKPIEQAVGGESKFLVFYGTGLRHRTDLEAVTVGLGGFGVNPLYAEEAPGYVGLDQINLPLPKAVEGLGEVTVTLTVDGIKAQPVKVTFK